MVDYSEYRIIINGEDIQRVWFRTEPYTITVFIDDKKIDRVRSVSMRYNEIILERNVNKKNGKWND